jgi:hypothetical protein
MAIGIGGEEGELREESAGEGRGGVDGGHCCGEGCSGGCGCEGYRMLISYFAGIEVLSLMKLGRN